MAEGRLIIHLGELSNFDCLPFGFYHGRVEGWLDVPRQPLVARPPQPPLKNSQLPAAFLHQNTYISAVFFVEGPQHSPTLSDRVEFAFPRTSTVRLRFSLWLFEGKGPLPVRQHEDLPAFALVAAREVSLSEARGNFAAGLRLAFVPHRLMCLRLHMCRVVSPDDATARQLFLSRCAQLVLGQRAAALESLPQVAARLEEQLRTVEETAQSLALDAVLEAQNFCAPQAADPAAVESLFECAVRELAWSERIETTELRGNWETLIAEPGDWRVLSSQIPAPCHMRIHMDPLFEEKEEVWVGVAEVVVAGQQTNSRSPPPARPLLIRPLGGATKRVTAGRARALVRFNTSVAALPRHESPPARPFVHVPLEFPSEAKSSPPPQPAARSLSPPAAVEPKAIAQSSSRCITQRFSRLFSRAPNSNPRAVLFLVHGLEGSWEDLRITASVWRFLLPTHLVHVCESLEGRTSDDIAAQGERLAAEMRAVLAVFTKPRVSVLGHSLGGLVARSACSRLVDVQLHALATLATPHLGCGGGVVIGAALRVLSSRHMSVRQMSLADGEQYLIKLNMSAGVELFTRVMLIGVEGDGYVPLSSALMARDERCRAAMERPGALQRLVRVTVRSPGAGRGWDRFVGRQAHVELLTNGPLLLNVWSLVAQHF